MAEFIKSEWRVTLGTTVLLDFDDNMLAEPAMPQSHAVQVQSYLRSDWPAVWDRGNVQFNLEFSVVLDFSTTAAARDHLVSQSLTLAALRHGALKVEVRNGSTTTLTDAAIESAAPQMGPELGSAARVAWEYSITAAGN